MAFTGAFTVKQVSDNVVRLSGAVTLAGDASGTIGLHGDSGADAQLPASFHPSATKFDDAVVSLADAISVTVNPTTDVTAAVPISVTKGGSPFRITLHNDTAGTASGQLEVYVKFLT